MPSQIHQRSSEKRITKTVLALKAARLTKGLSRQAAGQVCGCSARAFEQLENGRCNFTEGRIRLLIEKMGISWLDFERLRRDPKKTLAEIKERKLTERSLDRKPRRNHYKIVTKEVRVIRLLRKQKGISQYQASRLCGYALGGFGHIEVGRIELKRDKIEHILRSLGYMWTDFERLMKAPILRDEVITETVSVLHQLDDQALSSAVNIIKALLK